MGEDRNKPLNGDILLKRVRINPFLWMNFAIVECSWSGSANYANILSMSGLGSFVQIRYCIDSVLMYEARWLSILASVKAHSLVE